MKLNDSGLLYKPTKIKTNKRNVLFWGCLHLSHNPVHWPVPIWKQRGFNSSQEHFEGLISRWNQRANEETVGFLLGDNVFGANAAQDLIKFLNQIKFKTIYLMPGNHYAGIRNLFHDNNILFFQGKTVILVPNYLDIIVNNQSIVASHYPILSWNGAAGGSWMLYSHVHGNLGRSEIGKLYQSLGRTREVSVEASLAGPLSVENLELELNGRAIFSPDHHTGETQNPF